MFGGSSIILLAVYLVARNMALDLEVFFFISLSSHQSKNQRTNGPVNAHLISWPSTYKTWKIYG